MSAASVPVTHRRVLAIALPIVLSNATIPILGAVDTAVVGQLGLAAPIGAVGLGAIILTSIYWVFGFLRMGTTGLVAQARGAGEAAETGALLMRGVMIAAAAGAVFIAGQAAVFWAAFRLAPASPEVEALARTYLGIRIWGAPATIAIYALTGWLIAMERARGVLALQLLMNAVNVVLDLWFVLGLGWGVAGVAVATLIAEWSGLLLGLWLCRAAFAGAQWRDWGRVFDPARLRHMARVNGDILVRSVVLQASFTSFLFLGAGLGDVTLAANQVLLQFLSIAAFALDGFAFAAEALVGQTLGGRDRAGLRRAAVDHLGVGRRLRAGDGARLPGRRAGADRPHGHGAGGAGGGARLPALGGGGAAGRDRGLDARRHLHRRHRDAGAAERHAPVGRRSTRWRWRSCCRGSATTGSGRR